MIGHRHFLGMSIAAFVTSFVFMGGGLLLQLSGSPSGVGFGLLSLPLLYIGVLAAWLGRWMKQQSERLERVEAALQSR